MMDGSSSPSAEPDEVSVADTTHTALSHAVAEEIDILLEGGYDDADVATLNERVQSRMDINQKNYPPLQPPTQQAFLNIGQQNNPPVNMAVNTSSGGAAGSQGFGVTGGASAGPQGTQSTSADASKSTHKKLAPRTA